MTALFTDFYELTMMQGFFNQNKHKELTIFDMFYRENPDDGGFSIFCGLEQLLEYLENLKFTKEDIGYLREQNIFTEEFLFYLTTFRFTGTVFSVPEGSVIFPNTPIIKVIANIMEAHLIEGALLNITSHQSLIATKTARIVSAAGSKPVVEFGMRRAQGFGAAHYGARASIIGGAVGTSNVQAAYEFGLKPIGTHSHSWVMSHADELTSFREYAKAYPHNCILLVDTFNTLKSGLPNAIQVFKEFQGRLGAIGIRLDSGDISYTSKIARKLLDEAGFPHAKIVASNDLDENIIRDLDYQGAVVDMYGIGTKLITSATKAYFGGVYKMSAREVPIDGVNAENGTYLMPVIKLSDSSSKINNPGNKTFYRIYDNQGYANADLITLEEEGIDSSNNLTLFDPSEPWKKKMWKANEYTIRPMLVKVFEAGRLYKPRTTVEIAEYSKRERNTLWSETSRLLNPHKYHVDLSPNLYALKRKLIETALGGF
ncbi:MAG: nicotinate phosphoribosyltransferase [Defluviitaleaceae bacterium]|nr:nicotinate phosphoribosyltransferase [Defluviitaleaceae bacterium]